MDVMDNPLAVNRPVRPDDTAAPAAAADGVDQQPSMGSGDVPLSKRPDVPAPMGWFAGGLWAKLDEPLVIWGLRTPFLLGILPWIAFIIQFGEDLTALIWITGGLTCAISFIFALEELCALVRADTGALVQLSSSDLGGAPLMITAASHDSLVRWRRSIYGFAVIWFCFPILLISVTLLPFMLAAGEGASWTTPVLMLLLLWLALIGPLFAVWYMSLRLACALARESVAQLAASLVTPGVVSLSVAEWNFTVRAPAIALAEVTMPALSRWGHSTAALAGGLGALGIGFLNMGLRATGLWANFSSSMCIFFFAAALSLVLVPASVSTECETLLGTLNQLRKSADDSDSQGRISQLESFLKGCNREQGIGFQVFGAVINRQQIKVLFAKLWAVLVAIYVVLEPWLNPTVPDLSDLDAAASSRLCEPGWHHADSSCYRIFGDVEEVDWKTWVAAEAHCQEFGGNLASVTTQVQNDATLAVAGGLTVWIGLTDRVEEGVFVWSNGEPVSFTNWHHSEPADGNPAKQQSNDPEPNDAEAGISWPGCEGTGEDCAILVFKNGSPTWVDTNCASKAHVFGDLAANRRFEWRGADGTCLEFRLPYLCSKPSTPAVAHGGLMHGCKNGGWMIGTSHNNPDLPPTISFGVYNQSIYNKSASQKHRVNVSVTTAAECVTLVRQNFPDANAAQYSNTGRAECDAVYNASGLIYDPALQTCLFDDNWPVGSQDRRRLEGSMGECKATSKDFDRLTTAFNSLKAAHTKELNEIKRQQMQTKAMLEELLQNQRRTT